MTLEVHARERALGVDARLRQGAPFLLLQVHRPERFGSALLTQPAQLHVHPYMLRLAPDGDALVLLELPGTRTGARGGARTLAGELHAESDAHATPSTTRLLLSELRGVVLGAPSWISRSATFDRPALQRVSDEAEACGASSPLKASPMKRAISPARLLKADPLKASPMKRAISPARLLKADPADAFATAAPPPTTAPTWHFVTLQRRQGTPIFLCASSAAQAITWVAGLAPRVPAFSAEAAGMPSPPPPTYAQLLWRRVRLRLDTRAAQLAASAVVDGGGGRGSGGGRGGGGGGGGSASRLGVLAAMLHEMAAEEASRREWVRYHLRQGDNESAARLGWEPPAAAAAQLANGGSSGDDNGALGELM
jgi:hypothetical protein